MIAVKDMQMPLCCAECHISEVDCKHKKTAFVRYSRGDFARPFDCPLIEIITCKDCKHCDFDDSDQTFFCNTYGNIVCSSHFCSDGERRK